MRFVLNLLCVVSIFSVYGCRVKQLRHDQDHMRQAVLEMNENQIMDNLIRAYKGLPILHMDYTRATGTIRQNVGGDAGGNNTLTRTTNMAGMLTRQLRGFFDFGVNARNENTLTLTGEPVLANNQVYIAYVTFLELDPNTLTAKKLVESYEPPPHGAAHMVRQCGEVYYWIPAEYKYDFLELSLTTTGARGRPLVVPKYFKVSVTDVSPTMGDDGLNQTLFAVTISRSIPADNGFMHATLGDIKEKLPLSIVSKPGKPTNKFEVEFKKGTDFKKRLETLKQLLGQTVEIELEKFRPAVPTTTNVFKDIRAELEQIRLGGTNQ